MKLFAPTHLLFALTLAAANFVAAAQSTLPDRIPPSQPVPAGKAPGMKSKLIKDTPEEKVYAITFRKGDEALSGLTDFAIKNRIGDAHFTAIGAVSSATLAWLSQPEKMYHRIPVTSQSEVLSLVGDIATYNGKPIVHMHCVLGHEDGSTIGGHIFQANINPTLEVFMTVNTTPLTKTADDASGMKVINPAP